MKSGLTLVDQIDRYIQGITNYGPLFRDMKINGRTILSKESIRQWKETNEQLPLHHRLSITNEAPEKLGGLQKTKHVSNGSKIWRKNSSKNYTQQIQILNIQNKRSVHYVKTGQPNRT